MLSFAGMLLAPFDANKKERKKPVPPKSGPILKARSQGRYRLIMEGKTLSTGEIASIQGITHMGCLSSLYQMEKDGFIERKGLRAKEGKGKATILWGWK